MMLTRRSLTQRIFDLVTREMNFKNNNMKNAIFLLFGFFSLCVFLVGCSASKSSSNYYYQFYSLDTTILKDYYLCTFLRSNDASFYVLSDKTKNNNYDTLNYSTLEYMKYYSLDLNKIDTLFCADLSAGYYRGKGQPEIIIDNKLFWKNGKIVRTVYKSNELNGLYVNKLKIHK